MKRVLRLALGLLIAGAVLASPIHAMANPCAKAKLTGKCVVQASEPGDDETVSEGDGAGRSGPSLEETARKQAAAYRKVADRYATQLAAYTQCLSTVSDPDSCTSPTPALARVPDAIVVITGGSGAPVITPGQAGSIAVARLQLPLNAPSVGPDPKLNKWKMAAVGYPLWVWADGPAHVGPVSDSVGGLSVSLDAQLTKTVFRMGDGESITCVGAGTPYKKGVRAGTPSPNCGYRYQKPSLPKGTYTVSAISYWAVTWTINGTSGVITVPRQTSMPLPVGEVQVLVR